jgi:hypothetical protein
MNMVKSNSGIKINQEKQTIKCMIILYCHRQHHTKDSLCERCSELYQYAISRLTFCRFGEDKPTCENCHKHCYRRDYQQQIRKIMRYAGPRMIIYHPIMAIRHLLKNRQSKRTNQ